MRVNVEDDLFTERRLAKLARFLKIPEHQALGLLVLFWRSTQSQEIIRAPRERLETLAAMEVDADPSQWIDAMLAAQLASIDGAEIVIRGNAPHVERIIKLRSIASSGGKARYKQINEKLNVSEAVIKPSSSRNQALPAPFSDLLTPYTNTNTNTGSFSKQLELTEVVSAEFDSRRLSESAPRVSAKPKRSASEQEAAKLVKDAFHAGYRKRYGRPITGWGVPQNAHIYHLLKIWPAHELATLAVAYFAWPRSGPIEAGHPFMGNPKSFSANLEALHADTFKADRRVEAAGIRQQDRDFDVRAANESTLDRVFTKLGAQENGKLEPATGSEQQRFTAAQTSNLFADGRAQSADVRGSDDALGQEVVTVCKGKGPVGGS